MNKLGIIQYIFIVGCLFPVSDVPISISFENPLFSTPFTQAMEISMHTWSDIRTAHDMLNTQHNQDDYNTFVYAILGQLLCLERVINECNSLYIPEDDIAYLANIVSKMKQESTQLTLSPVQEHTMKELLEMIEKNF